MKKRYRILKRVSVILILFALFTKIHPQKVPTNNIPKVEINVEKASQEDYTIIKIPFRIEHKTLFIGIFILIASAFISGSQNGNVPPRGN